MAMQRRDRDRREEPQSEFKEKLVAVNRVSKTVKGGRNMRFVALVVVGDEKGRVGVGMAAKVVLLPAEEGAGVIAGGAARPVLELAGIKDIRTKSFGTNNKINTVKATVEGLKLLRNAEQVAQMRGKTVEEILG